MGTSVGVHPHRDPPSPPHPPRASFLHTTSAVVAPPNAPSLHAKDVYKRYFPSKLMEFPYSEGVVVLSKDPTNHPVTSPAVEALSHRVVEATFGMCGKDALPLRRMGSGIALCWWRQAFGLFVDDAAEAGGANTGENADFEAMVSAARLLLLLRCVSA